MKVGDLIKFRGIGNGSLWNAHAIIIEVGVYVGRKDIKVLWNNGDVETAQSKSMVVISESR